MARMPCVLLIGLFAACDSPRGATLDTAYVTSMSYVLMSRPAYFPGRADRICVAGGLGQRAGHLSFYHIPVSKCDERVTASDPSSHQAITLWTADHPPLWEYDEDLKFRFHESYEMEGGEIGYRPEPLLEYWWRRLTTRLPRWVSTEIYYSDRRVAEARFECLLVDRRTSWALRRCLLSEVRWRSSASSEAEVVGCWGLEWTAVHLASTKGLPREVRLSTVLSDSEWDDVAYQVTPYQGRDSTGDRTEWEDPLSPGIDFDWRWSSGGAGVFAIRAGGGFEGLEVRFVVDPDGPTIRGEGSHWDDTPGGPGELEPDWRLRGTSVECR